ncbi:MAG: 3-dehydroquinate synthase [Myxococcota bacterium]
MRIFLSGPMGAGKSTVATAVAERLGAPALDLDARVEERVGCTIAEVFRDRGEAGFRRLEREMAREVIEEAGDVVVALGGGTVTDPATRRLLLSSGLLVTLTAPVDELARRVGAGEGRPLVAGGDVGRRLSELLTERADAYAECHAEVGTAHRTLEQVAREVLAWAADPPVVVPLGRRTYRVEIGAGVRHRLGRRALEASRGGVAVVVTDGGAAPWAEGAHGNLNAAGRRVVPVTLEAGEEHKTVGSVERIWDAALDGGLDRDGLVVGVGGGVVGDLTAFAASTLLRGVALGQVPTTLLAMVDSSVGGKTGFDRPQGKNLVGTFHQPRFVLCDVECLSTLPEGERRAGLAEVAKSAWLDGEASVSMLERDARALTEGDPDSTARAIRMSVELKARIVTEDEREAGPRMLLNLGHTIGHAIEAAAGYRGIRHGEAVSLGMVAAFRVAEGLGKAPPGLGARMERLLAAFGLPVDLDRHLDDRILGFVGSDKKRRGDQIRFVVPAHPGATGIVPIERDALRGLLGR